MNQVKYLLQVARPAKEGKIVRVFQVNGVYDNAIDANVMAETAKRCFPGTVTKVVEVPYFAATNVSAVQAKQAAE